MATLDQDIQHDMSTVAEPLQSVGLVDILAPNHLSRIDQGLIASDSRYLGVGIHRADGVGKVSKVISRKLASKLSVMRDTLAHRGEGAIPLSQQDREMVFAVTGLCLDYLSSPTHDKASLWYEAAASSRYPDAVEDLGVALRLTEGRINTKDYQDQLAEARQIARRVIVRVAGKGPQNQQNQIAALVAEQVLTATLATNLLQKGSLSGTPDDPMDHDSIHIGLMDPTRQVEQNVTWYSLRKINLLAKLDQIFSRPLEEGEDVLSYIVERILRSDSALSSLETVRDWATRVPRGLGETLTSSLKALLIGRLGIMEDGAGPAVRRLASPSTDIILVPNLEETTAQPLDGQVIDALFANVEERKGLENKMVVDGDGVRWTIDALQEDAGNRIATLRAEIPAVSAFGDASYAELMCGYLDGEVFYNLTDFDAQKRVMVKNSGQDACILGQALLSRFLNAPQQRYVERPAKGLAY